MTVVVFTDYRELNQGRLHSTYRLLEVTRHDELLGDLEIHFVELPELAGMNDEEREAEAALERWARFLAAKTDEELEEVAEEDEMINKAKGVLEDLSEDPRARELASWREAHLALERMQREEERREALAEGEARGRAEGEARGRAEGEARGRAEGKRDTLLMLFYQKGIALNDEQRQRIESCDDTARLDEWLRRAFAGNDVEEILA